MTFRHKGQALHEILRIRSRIYKRHVIDKLDFEFLNIPFKYRIENVRGGGKMKFKICISRKLVIHICSAVRRAGQSG